MQRLFDYSLAYWIKRKQKKKYCVRDFFPLILVNSILSLSLSLSQSNFNSIYFYPNLLFLMNKRENYKFLCARFKVNVSQEKYS